MEVEKIDMSLDDIIKLNRKEQRGKGRGQGRARGTRGVRGRGVLGGRGMSAGRGRGAARGRGARGQTSTRGNRGKLGKARGGQTNFKGRGQNKFKQLKTTTKVSRGRGRGQKRGQAGNQTGVSPLNRSMSDLRQNLTGGTRQGVKQTLQQRRTKALQALQNAKETLAKIQMQQKSSRQNTVNNRRGIQTQYNTTQNKAGRGRGRGRGRGTTRGRGARGRGSVYVNQNFRSQQQYGSTTSLASQNNRKRRQWRPSKNTSQDNILLVHVNNQKPLPRLKQQQQNKPTFRQQILNLKPSQSQSFNMQKKFFAQNTTGVSLSDRFTGGQNNFAGPSGDGRRVFF